MVSRECPADRSSLTRITRLIKTGDLSIVFHWATHLVLGLLTASPGDGRVENVVCLFNRNLDLIHHESNDLLAIDLSGRRSLP